MQVCSLGATLMMDQWWKKYSGLIIKRLEKLQC